METRQKLKMAAVAALIIAGIADLIYISNFGSFLRYAFCALYLIVVVGVLLEDEKFILVGCVIEMIGFLLPLGTEHYVFLTEAVFYLILLLSMKFPKLSGVWIAAFMFDALAEPLLFGLWRGSAIPCMIIKIVAGVLLVSALGEADDFVKRYLSPQERSGKRFSRPLFANTVGSSERLEKLSALLDKGIITQEEFDAKKKEIIGQ